jgi:hypothetical protein
MSTGGKIPGIAADETMALSMGPFLITSRVPSRARVTTMLSR